MDKRICKYAKCGKEFTPTSTRQMYCCKKCRTKMNHEKQDVCRRSYVRKRVKRNTGLHTMAKTARELGMSYGQYVAYMEKGEKENESQIFKGL